MNCHDYQKEMLVFDLLDSSEQTKLEAHINTCAACQAEWIKVEKLNNSLVQARQRSTVAEHPVQLTDRIMTTVIEIQRGKAAPMNSKSWLFSNFFKLGLAGLSVSLMIGFIAEFSAPVMHVPGSNRIGSQKIILQGDWLKAKLPVGTQSTSSRQPCIANHTSDLSCLKLNLHRVIQNLDNKN